MTCTKGVKLEISVLPKGLAASTSRHNSDFTSDFQIFQWSEEWYMQALSKKEFEAGRRGVGIQLESYPKIRAALVEKGYQGSLETLRPIYPVRKPPREILSISHSSFNRNFSSDLVLVESYFGRLSTLCKFCSGKWRWPLNLYEDFFRISVSFNHFQIKSLPLRSADSSKFVQIRNRNRYIANEKTEGRQKAIHRYRDQRRVQINHKLRLY